MALRNITIRGDEILAKKCKPVKEITPRIAEACADMVETMIAADGVGIAAPQIGIMKRFFLAMPHVDAEDEETRNRIYVMINPEITYKEGTQESSEGCLSVPGKVGTVTRPQKVVCEAFNEEMQPIRIEAENLLARAICHELDHLDGHLYTELVEGELRDAQYTEEEPS